MKVRYQADADLDRRIIRATCRREPSIDFQLASEAQSGKGLRGLSDDQVLAIAAQEGRLLVTHDRRTMPSTLLNSSRQNKSWSDRHPATNAVGSGHGLAGHDLGSKRS